MSYGDDSNFALEFQVDQRVGKLPKARAANWGVKARSWKRDESPGPPLDLTENAGDFVKQAWRDAQMSRCVPVCGFVQFGLCVRIQRNEFHKPSLRDNRARTCTQVEARARPATARLALRSISATQASSLRLRIGSGGSTLSRSRSATRVRCCSGSFIASLKILRAVAIG
jgi:hypothetical protein